MLEKKIESALVGACTTEGWQPIKLNSSSCRGLPDRLILMPDGRVVFVELKAPGKKPRALQKLCHRKLTSLGFKVYVIDSIEQIGGFVDEIRSTQLSGNGNSENN